MQHPRLRINSGGINCRRISVRHVDDLESETERLLVAGARLVERRGGEHFRWNTLADPDGNEFCAPGQHV